MIGCNGYTDVIECSQYVNDVAMMKGLSIIILVVVSISLIYYSKTKSYKKLTNKYDAYDKMLKVPIWFSYTALFFMIIAAPLIMSVNVTYDTFLTMLWAIYIPAIGWAILFIFQLLAEWIFKKLGFDGGKSFVRYALKLK